MKLNNEILLVDMPFSFTPSPSLGLGLLKATLKDVGIACKILHADLLFWEQYDVAKWTAKESTFIDHFKELVFYKAFFEKDCPQHIVDSVVRKWSESLSENELREWFHYIQTSASQFIHHIAIDITATSPKIIACTSTLTQHLSSLALLRHVKNIDHNIVTVMGGANLEAEMGVANHRHFDWIDYVFSGNADAGIIPLVKGIFDYGTKIHEKDLPEGVLGPIHRQKGYPATAPRAFFNKLDSSPIPDYDDYFSLLARSPRMAAILKPTLLYESSRGCRWGENGGCKFCGLNGKQHAYIAKTPQKVIDDLEIMAKRYNVNRFEMTDNMVPPEYQYTLFAELATRGAPFRLFYETRAVATQEYYRIMRKAGVVGIQPGIESLSTPLLKHINKGIQAWQAIQCLKWARLYGFYVSWNIMWGFPKENTAWYSPMVALLPKLFHLFPPRGFNRMQFCRFSEFWTEQTKGSNDLRPINPNGLAFDFNEPIRKEISYSFYDDEATNPRQDSPFVKRTMPQILSKWKSLFSERNTDLTSTIEADKIYITDNRPKSEEVNVAGGPSLLFRPEKNTYVYAAAERAMLEYCDTAPLEQHFLQEWGAQGKGFLEDAAQKNLIIPIDKRLVSLVLPNPLPHQPLTFDEAFQ